MKNEKAHSLTALALGLGLALLAVWAMSSKNSTVDAASPAELHVCPTDCAYSSIQDAVDAASDGDTIKVAAGTYDTVVTLGTYTQVVIIYKSVTIQGGYTTAFTEPPDPAGNPTILDAQGQGRVIAATGELTSINPTIAGLHITGGDASGFGGAVAGGDAGGGVYALGAAVTISDCTIYSNTASTVGRGLGGGVYAYSGTITLAGNTVSNNTASTAGQGYGGGVCAESAAITLTGNTVSNNTASTASVIDGKGVGGGICVLSGQATLSGNAVQGNTADTGKRGLGGGIALADGDFALSGNIVQSNTASAAGTGYGGGIYLADGDFALSDSTVQSNTASTAGGGCGGGIALANGDFALSGNTIQNNTASTAGAGYGGGIQLDTGDITFEDNTVQLNVASTITNGQGGGLAMWYSNATLSRNAILSNTATLNAGANGQGGGLFAQSCLTLTNNIVADNHASFQGSGLWIGGSAGDPSDGRLLHTTITGNRGSASAIHVDGYTTLAFTNTIIAIPSIAGIAATAPSTVTLETTLWHGDGSWIWWPSKVTTSNDVTGDPAFIDPSGWDYHLGAGSAAVDRGLDTGVGTDIDGDQRPIDGDCNGTAAADIGADESPCQCYIHLPLALRQFP
jgi:hypothetical protein